jgi:rhodanese-related sulfurtransferase
MHEVYDMKRRHIWLSTMVLIALSLLITACGQSTAPDENPVMGMYPRNRDGYADISAKQLNELLESQDVTLVNVHIPYEGELPHTDLFIPFNEISDHLDELPAEDAPIVLYCEGGGMSASAGKELASLGYTNVAELDGGMNAWERASYEVLHR